MHNQQAHERTHICALADLPPGRLRYAEIDGLPIAIANVGGVIYAFGDTCRHEGGPLSTGVLINETITCPWHGWTYNVRTGKAIVPPLPIRIPTYPTTIEHGEIFVMVSWDD